MRKKILYNYPESEVTIFHKCGNPKGPATTIDEGWNLAFRVNNLTTWLRNNRADELQQHRYNLRKFSRWLDQSPPEIRDVVRVMMRMRSNGIS